MRRSDAFSISSSTVILRVEGLKTTFYEGSITSGPRNITTAESGVTVPCDGTFANDNLKPGNTMLDALDAASKAKGFTYDGTFDGEFNDFAIDRISTDSMIDTDFWGTFINYQLSQYGEGINLSGCQQQVKNGDEVLYALITTSFPGPHTAPKGVSYLKVAPTSVTVKVGDKVTVTVIDGLSGTAIQNATIHGVLTDSSGKATLTLTQKGSFKYKATKAGDIRSNALSITVTS